MSNAALRMAAIFRADLPLPPGKLAAQAGHAFLAAWCLADDSVVQAYADTGTAKIVLVAPNLAVLERIHSRALQRGVPRALIVDAARTVLKEPTVTVLGLGPMNRTDFNALTRGLNLL